MKRTKTHNTILPMPLITRAMVAGSIYVTDGNGLRKAVLRGEKIICISERMNMAVSIELAGFVLDSIVLP